ncbi:hypothetical protein [Flavobacterium sp. H4147]|uniref:hypothetical protein n=1 Tax=Flavobacterium sp. H4147 TaxID=3034149 RepID=UPI0023EAD67F|nr:hypothetical protein [Flavobacterium sp. H4147]
MNDLEKFNLEKLSPSEMKEVHGGGLLDTILDTVKSVEDVVTPIISALAGSGTNP